MTQRQITESDALAVLRVVDNDLRSGVVAPALRRFEIGLNVARWSGNSTHVQSLRRVVLAQLGTFGTLDERMFTEKLSRAVIVKLLPPVFMRVSELCEEPHKSELMEAAYRCETEGTSASARSAATTASKYGREYAADMAAEAASRAADAAAYLEAPAAEQSPAQSSHAVEKSVDSAVEALGNAADALYSATYRVAGARAKTIRKEFWAAKAHADTVAKEADAAALARAKVDALLESYSDAVAKKTERACEASNRLLCEFAEEVVQILVEMKTPGSDFLYLTQ